MARFDFNLLHKAPTFASYQHKDARHNGNSEDSGLPSDDIDKAYFTAEEAAAYMKLSLEAFQVLAADPELQPVRVMGVYHYRVAAVQRFLIKMESEGR